MQSATRPSDLLCVARESDSGELPAFFRLKEITIGTADVSARGGAGTTAQDVLVAHEFAVVLAKRAGSGAITRVWRVGAARPFPNVAEHLNQLSIVLRSFCRAGDRMKQFGFDEIALDWTTQRCALPFELCWESSASPVRIRVRFEIADVRDRFRVINGAKTGEREIPPGPVALCPVKRRGPALFVHSHPAER